MKGIILAAVYGTRLYPVTMVVVERNSGIVEESNSRVVEELNSGIVEKTNSGEVEELRRGKLVDSGMWIRNSKSGRVKERGKFKIV